MARNFGELLAERLAKIEMSPRGLSMRSGVSESTIEKIIAGEIIPSGPVLQHICNITGIEYNEKLTQSEDKPDLNFEALLAYVRRFTLSPMQKERLIQEIQSK